MSPWEESESASQQSSGLVGYSVGRGILVQQSFDDAVNSFWRGDATGRQRIDRIDVDYVSLELVQRA